MPRYTAYVCGVCGKPFEPELLMAKKAVFSRIGRGAKPVKNRTIVWLCPDDLEKDADWKKEKYDSPGLKSVTRENVRALQRIEDGN